MKIVIWITEKVDFWWVLVHVTVTPPLSPAMSYYPTRDGISEERHGSLLYSSYSRPVVSFTWDSREKLRTYTINVAADLRSRVTILQLSVSIPEEAVRRRIRIWGRSSPGNSNRARDDPPSTYEDQWGPLGKEGGRSMVLYFLCRVLSEQTPLGL